MKPVVIHTQQFQPLPKKLSIHLSHHRRFTLPPLAPQTIHTSTSRTTRFTHPLNNHGDITQPTLIPALNGTHSLTSTPPAHLKIPNCLNSYHQLFSSQSIHYCHLPHAMPINRIIGLFQIHKHEKYIFPIR